MLLQTTFHGHDLLFEGDLPLRLRAIPAGATITRAIITLEPVTSALGNSPLFQETLSFQNGRGPFSLLAESQNSYLILDLGARRTLKRVAVSGVSAADNAHVQLDMGGLWLALDNNAGIVTPDTDAADRRWPLIAQNNLELLNLPDLAGQRFRLRYVDVNGGNETGVSGSVAESIILQSYPSNLTLRLGNVGPFWFRAGDLRDPVDTPDFSDILQAVLQRELAVAGIRDLTLILHSDTLARLRLTLNLEYELAQSLLPAELESIIYTYEYDSVPAGAAAPLTISVPANATLQTAQIAITQRFGSSRVVHGPLGLVEIADSVIISPAQSLAHAIKLDAPHEVEAIDLHVEALTDTATLSLTLQEDAGGKPFGPALWPKPVTLSLTRPEAGSASWVSAPLPTPFTFAAGQTYWLIVNSAVGEVAWGAESTADRPPLLVTQDNALSWRAAVGQQSGGNLAGLYRLRAAPATYRQPIVADVAGRRVSFDKYNGLRDRPLQIDDWPELVAAGNQALAAARAARATRQERIHNGRFAAWTRLEPGTRPAAQPIIQTDGVFYWTLATAPDATRLFAAAFRPDQEPQPGWIEIISNESNPYPAGRINLPTLEHLPTPLALALSAAPGTDTLHALVLDQRMLGSGSPPEMYLLALDPDRNTADFVAQVSPRLSEIEDPFQSPSLQPSPDGRALYVATRSTAFPEPYGNLVEFPALLRLPAEMGSETYVADENDVMPLVQREGDSWQQADDVPLDFVLTPDGRCAIVGAERALLLADLQSKPWPEGFLGRAWFPDEVPPRLLALALSPDGQRLYLLTQEPAARRSATPAGLTLWVVDPALLETAARTGSLQNAVVARKEVTSVPVAARRQGHQYRLATTPDGHALLLTTTEMRAGSERLQVRLLTLDAHTLETRHTTRLAGELVNALAVTPDSRRLYLAGIAGRDPVAGHLQMLELNRWSADGWALTGGRAAPIHLAGTDAFAARLGSPDQSAGFSQVFAVAAGEPYELRFRAWTAGPNVIAELIWLDASCGAPEVAEIAIPPTTPAVALHTFLWRGRAPAAAVAAELRFRVPAGNYLLLDNVSFAAPEKATLNGDFAVVAPPTAAGEPAVPQGWTLGKAIRPAADTITWPATGGLRLTAGPATPASLQQSLALQPGQPFTLTIQGHPHGPLSSQGSAHLTLSWVGSAEPSLKHTFIAEQYDLALYQGTVPDDATGAELRLVQPPGGTLHLDRVEVTQPDLVTIPVTLLAEAPGEVVISNPTVSFEVGTPPLPPSSEAELVLESDPAGPETIPAGCAPTPPDAAPPLPTGEGRPGTAHLIPEPLPVYCPCCEQHHMLKTPQTVFVHRVMRGRRGVCPNCGTTVVAF